LRQALAQIVSGLPDPRGVIVAGVSFSGRGKGANPRSEVNLRESRFLAAVLVEFPKSLGIKYLRTLWGG
jgi:hypothetical protein